MSTVKSIYDQLYPIQRKLVDRELPHDSNALFTDVGTGKSIMSIALMESKPIETILIVCPKSKIYEWVEDYKRWGNKTLIPLDKGTKRNQKLIDSADGYVVNFESVFRLDFPIDNTWGIIVDESHRIKNRKAKVTKYMMKLGEFTPYKIIATGTPQSQGYIDYWSQMHFIDKWDIGITKFHNEFCKMGYLYLGKQKLPQIVGYKNTETLESMVNDNATFHRRDKGDLVPTENIVDIKPIPRYDRFFKDKVLKIKNEYILGDTMGAYRMGLRQLASGFIREHDFENNKAQWVKDFLDGYNDRVVIFYNFNRELEHLKVILGDRPYSEYNGSKKDLTNYHEHENAVALVNFGSGSTGINDFVNSEVAIFYSPTEDVITFKQAMGRLDRIGQERKPLFYFLKSSKTVEDKIYESIMSGKDFDDNLWNLYLTQSN